MYGGFCIPAVAEPSACCWARPSSREKRPTSPNWSPPPSQLSNADVINPGRIFLTPVLLHSKPNQKTNGWRQHFFRWCHLLPLKLPWRDFSLSLLTNTQTHTQNSNSRRKWKKTRVDPRLLSTHTHPHTHIQRPLTHQSNDFFLFFFLPLGGASRCDAFICHFGICPANYYTHTQPLELIIYHGMYTQTHTGLVSLTHIHNTLLSQQTHTLRRQTSGSQLWASSVTTTPNPTQD